MPDDKIQESDLILYSFRRCPYAMRARLSVYYSENLCQLREISLKKKPREFLSLSPKGTVPVLFVSNNLLIEESLDIVKWFLGNNDPNNLMKPYTSEDPDHLINLIDDKFKFHLDRYKYSSRYDSKEKYYHRDQALSILEVVEKKITSEGYIYEDALSIYEVCIFPFIRQFRIADESWFDNKFPFSKIRLSLSKFIRSAAFIEVMRKYTEWSPSDKVIKYFPKL